MPNAFAKIYSRTIGITTVYCPRTHNTRLYWRPSERDYLWSVSIFAFGSDWIWYIDGTGVFFWGKKHQQNLSPGLSLFFLFFFLKINNEVKHWSLIESKICCFRNGLSHKMISFGKFDIVFELFTSEGTHPSLFNPNDDDM